MNCFNSSFNKLRVCEIICCFQVEKSHVVRKLSEKLIARLSLWFCYSLNPYFPFHVPNWGLYIAVSLSLRLYTCDGNDVTFLSTKSWFTICYSFLVREMDSSRCLSLHLESKMLLEAQPQTMMVVSKEPCMHTLHSKLDLPKFSFEQYSCLCANLKLHFELVRIWGMVFHRNHHQFLFLWSGYLYFDILLNELKLSCWKFHEFDGQ